MRHFSCRSILLGLVLCLVADLRAAAEVNKVKIGAKIKNGSSLRDLRGNRRPLHAHKDHRAVVLAFLGTDCPVSSVYVPRLIQLAKKFHDKNVQFLAIYPNEGDDFDEVAAHASDRDVPFPVLKDFGQRLSDRVGVKRVPTVVVLDDQFVLRYRGRIDDQYKVGSRGQKPTRDDLGQAIDEVLAGKQVTVADTEVDGCLVDRAKKLPPRKDVTYAKQVARIVQNRCQICHRENENAPFALSTYQDAVQHARMIKEVTTQKRMPPWHADSRYGEFSNDRSLTPKEIDTIAAWVDGGMPFGDKKDLPEPKKFPAGWQMGKPDVVFELPEEFEVPAEGSLPYQYFTIQTNFTEDKWVQIAEARPGAAEVVHHIVVYILEPGQRRPFRADGTMTVLVGWAPGDLPLMPPEGTALRVPKGSRLFVEMHYTPNGKKTKDRSRIGLVFAKKPPERELFVNAFMNESIRIPANAPHHEELATLRFYHDARLISLLPHMHWRGKDFKYELIYPDGKKKILLSVPRWDFNWQTVYYFKEPVKVPKGSRLRAIAHWDNSKNNPSNPDPDKTVLWGLQTWEEMMVGWAAFVWEDPKTAEKIAKTKPNPADVMFDRMDRNGDDVITKEEVPKQLSTVLIFYGVKVPKEMKRAEFYKFYDEMQKKYRGRRNDSRPRSDGGSSKQEQKKPNK